MVTDYKEWIAQRADEIALQRYGIDFYDLPQDIAYDVWSQAECDYIDKYAAEIDAAYDRALEAKLIRESEEQS